MSRDPTRTLGGEKTPVSPMPPKPVKTDGQATSRGYGNPQDLWINKRDGGVQDVRGGRPDADADYNRNFKEFARTELASRAPNRDKGGEPGHARAQSSGREK